jgi:phage RecT family recombinase
MSTELKLVDSPQFAPIKSIMESTELQKHYEENNHFKMNLDREKMFAIQLIQKNDYLLKCTPESFYNALINITATGLTLNPMMQQAHLVPRSNKGKLEVCLDPDYKGLVTIMIKSGIAKDVFAHVVYRNDIFEYDATSETVIKYIPYWNREDKVFSEPGEERATFCCVINPDDTRRYRVMPISRVNEIMRGTEAYKSHAKKVASGQYSKTMWEGENRPDMIKKTVIRQMWKFIPKTDEMMFQALASAFEEHDKVYQNTEYDINKNIVEVQGTDVKVSERGDISGSVMNSIKKVTPKNSTKKAEIIESEEVSPADEQGKVSKAELNKMVMLIADNFDIDVTKIERRDDESQSKVKEMIKDLGVSESLIDTWLVSKKAKNSSLIALCTNADSNQINTCLISYLGDKLV